MLQTRLSLSCRRERDRICRWPFRAIDRRPAYWRQRSHSERMLPGSVFRRPERRLSVSVFRQSEPMLPGSAFRHSERRRPVSASHPFRSRRVAASRPEPRLLWEQGASRAIGPVSLSIGWSPAQVASLPGRWVHRAFRSGRLQGRRVCSLDASGFASATVVGCSADACGLTAGAGVAGSEGGSTGFAAGCSVAPDVGVTLGWVVAASRFRPNFGSASAPPAAPQRRRTTAVEVRNRSIRTPGIANSPWCPRSRSQNTHSDWG